MILKDIKKIYFIGICGTAMASLAAMFKARGYDVSGSDEGIYPPMSTFLTEQKIPVFQGYHIKHLESPPDLIVIGNVVSRGNPEVEYTLAQRLLYVSLPEAIREFFIRGHRSVVVTGTHGKTTTSSLLAWTLYANGYDPSFLIGGILENFGCGFQVGAGDYIVIEGDEYDTAFFDKGPKFLHYLPDYVVINNIEFDHADIYRSLDDIIIQFQRLANIIPNNGLLVACGDDKNVRAILPHTFCKVETFGLQESNFWSAQNISVFPHATKFDVLKEGKYFCSFSIPLLGDHNIKNTLAVSAILNHIGVKRDAIQKALLEFKGIRKRLQLVGEVRDVRIYDDFGHHPTAIRSTLAGLRNLYQRNRIWAIFEPRSATTRRAVFQQEFINSFDDADEILVAPVHRPDKAPQNDRLSVPQLVHDLQIKSKNAAQFNSVDDIVEYCRLNVQKNDIIITFSNGDFNGIHRKLLDALL